LNRLLIAAAAVLVASVGAVPAAAGGPDTGFFLGGGAHLTWIDGGGTWDTYDFRIDQPLSDENGNTLGLNWTDHVILGLKPMIGYRVSRGVTFQISTSLNIAKSSQQQYSEAYGAAYYESGMNVEWKQRDTEILAVFHTDSNLGFFYYAGVDLVAVTTDILLYEGVEYSDVIGDLISSIDYQDNSDSISATGLVVGAGVEIPSGSRTTSAFLSAQYSYARTDDTFFGTEGFKVDVGGFSFMAGVKWFPFAR